MPIIDDMKGRIKMSNMERKLLKSQGKSKSLFLGDSDDVQNLVSRMIKSFSDTIIDEDMVEESCNMRCELHDLDYVLKQIDDMSEHLDDPDIIDKTKQSVKDYYHLQRNITRSCFRDLECLSYQKGFKEAFKLFMKLID